MNLEFQIKNTFHDNYIKRIELIDKDFNIIIGIIDLSLENYGWFSDFCNQNFFNIIITQKHFVYLRSIKITERFRKQGYGNLMMSKLDEYVRILFPNTNKIVLYVFPDTSDIEKIPAFEKILKRFYKKYDFRSIVFPYHIDHDSHDDKNIMIKKI